MNTVALFEPKIGVLVNVESRTWPGINRPGGVGRITSIKYKEEVLCVDVEYIMGGKDKAVELEYVKKHIMDDGNGNGNGNDVRTSRRERRRPPDVVEEIRAAEEAKAKEKKEKMKSKKKKSKRGNGSGKSTNTGKGTSTSASTATKSVKRKNALKDGTSKANANSNRRIAKESDVEEKAKAKTKTKKDGKKRASPSTRTDIKTQTNKKPKLADAKMKIDETIVTKNRTNAGKIADDNKVKIKPIISKVGDDANMPTTTVKPGKKSSSSERRMQKKMKKNESNTDGEKSSFFNLKETPVEDAPKNMATISSTNAGTDMNMDMDMNMNAVKPNKGGEVKLVSMPTITTTSISRPMSKLEKRIKQQQQGQSQSNSSQSSSSVVEEEKQASSAAVATFSSSSTNDSASGRGKEAHAARVSPPLSQERERMSTDTGTGIGTGMDTDTNYLRTVYDDISAKATIFVEDIVGERTTTTKSKSESRSSSEQPVSIPSSPESTGSLELQIDDERENEFNRIFASIIRRGRLEEIDTDTLRTEVNAVADKPFPELEVRSLLERLDKENKVMVTWEGGKGNVYVI